MKRFILSALVAIGESVHRALFNYMGKTGMVQFAFPNVSDVIATTIQSRTGIIADNV